MLIVVSSSCSSSVLSQELEDSMNQFKKKIIFIRILKKETIEMLKGKTNFLLLKQINRKHTKKLI